MIERFKSNHPLQRYAEGGDADLNATIMVV